MSSDFEEAIKFGLANPDWALDQLDRLDCEESLLAFVRRHWSVLEPNTPFVDGWALEAVCEHLEAVTSGDINRLLINVPPGFMKLIADETPILTPDGYRRHGDLAVGDRVFAPDGAPARIIRISAKAPADYDVTFSTHETIKCNGDHLWTVFDRWAQKWKTVDTRWLAEAQVEKGRSRFFIPDTEPLQFPEAVLPLHPYFLGCWLGDGSATKPAITHDQDDRQHIDHLEALGYLVTKQYRQGRTVRSEFRHQGIADIMRAVGINGRKRIPRSYIESSIEQRCELLSGIIDTDGTVDQSRGRVLIYTTEPALAEQIQLLVLSLGMRPYLTTMAAPGYGDYKSDKTYHIIGFQPTMALPTRIPRKEIDGRNFEHRRRAIVMVEKSDNPSVGHCITIERPDGLYVVGRTNVVTHNSLLTNVFWPAWEWGPQRKAHLRYVTFSYAASLTERDNGRFRDLLLSQDYQRLWGDRFNLKEIGKIRVSNDKTGWKIASSVGGVSTGERGDRVLCLPAGERILTNRGWLEIDAVVNGKLDVLVCGRSDDGVLRWQTIERHEKNPGRKLVELTIDGASLRCTADHRVYVEGRGYIAAEAVREGDIVSTCGIQALCRVRTTDNGQAEPFVGKALLLDDMSVFSKGEDRNGKKQSSMHHMWRDGVSDAFPYEAHAEQNFLFSFLSRYFQQRKEQPSIRRWYRRKDVRLLWDAVFSQALRSEAGRVLLHFLQQQAPLANKASSASSVGKGMLRMRHSLSPSNDKQQETMLLSGLCGKSACVENERFGQWPLSSWGGKSSLSCGMDADIQGANKRARWQLLPRMWAHIGSWAARIARPSYRLREGKSGAVELDNGLSLLPWNDAWKGGTKSHVESAIVRSVRDAGYAAETYNISVVPHHNYFAEGILTHNCDDPHSVKESESDVVRAETVRWFREGMSNRLNDMQKSAIIVIMQRVHEADVSGAILENGQDYEHLMIPMEYDGRRYHTSIDWTDPREDDGELAWEERFSRKTVEDLKTVLGPYGYSGQYQQAPAPRGGGIFRREWWQLWGNPDDPADPAFRKFPNCEYIVASLDTAYTTKQENDYSALTVWGLWRDKYDLPKIILMSAWKDRLPIHELVERVSATCKRFKVDRLLIESKAAGISVAQEIRRLHSGEGYGVQLFDPKGGDKEARAYSVQHIFSDEMVYAPDRDWSDMVISEMASFPRAPHDDLTDSAVQALKHLRDIGLAMHGAELAQELGEQLAHRSVAKPLYPV